MLIDVTESAEELGSKPNRRVKHRSMLHSQKQKWYALKLGVIAYVQQHLHSTGCGCMHSTSTIPVSLPWTVVYNVDSSRLDGSEYAPLQRHTCALGQSGNPAASA